MRKAAGGGYTCGRPPAAPGPSQLATHTAALNTRQEEVESADHSREFEAKELRQMVPHCLLTGSGAEASLAAGILEGWLGGQRLLLRPGPHPVHPVSGGRVPTLGQATSGAHTRRKSNHKLGGICTAKSPVGQASDG